MIVYGIRWLRGYVLIDRELLRRLVNDARSCDQDCVLTVGDYEALRPHWEGGE